MAPRGPAGRTRVRGAGGQALRRGLPGGTAHFHKIEAVPLQVTCGFLRARTVPPLGCAPKIQLLQF